MQRRIARDVLGVDVRAIKAQGADMPVQAAFSRLRGPPIVGENKQGEQTQAFEADSSSKDANKKMLESRNNQKKDQFAFGPCAGPDCNLPGGARTSCPCPGRPPGPGL